MAQAKWVGLIMFSTDDAEIAEVSRAACAMVVMRSAPISTDAVSSEEALIHVLASLAMTSVLTVFSMLNSIDSGWGH